MYYSMLVVAEALGGSNNSQVVDLGGGAVGNTTNQFVAFFFSTEAPSSPDPRLILFRYTPTYAVYENGVPTRVLALNFVSDATGASMYDLVLDNLAANVSTVQVRSASLSLVNLSPLDHKLTYPISPLDTSKLVRLPSPFPLPSSYYS